MPILIVDLDSELLYVLGKIEIGTPCYVSSKLNVYMASGV